MTCQTSTTPVAVSPNSAKARTIATTWVTISVCRFGRWSAMTPPNSPKTMHRPELGDRDEPEPERIVVSWRTSQAWATCCIHVPMSEIELAAEEQPVVAVAEGADAVEPDRHRRGFVWCGAPAPRPASISARCVSRWTRRPSASPIISSSRSIFWRSVATWRSTRSSASSIRARRSPGPWSSGTARGSGPGRPRPRGAGRSRSG